VRVVLVGAIPMTARQQVSDVDETAVCGLCGTTLAGSGTTCPRCVSRSTKALADASERRGADRASWAESSGDQR
jgi:hypothetical protein